MLEKIKHMLAFILIIAMLAFPTAITAIKGVFLAALMAIVFLEIIKRFSLRIDREVLFLGVFFSSIGMIFIGLGIIRGAGFGSVFTIYVVWPIVFILLITMLKRHGQLEYLSYSLIAAALIVFLYVFDYLLESFGYSSSNFLPRAYEEEQYGYAIGEGFIEVSLKQLPSLIYIGPFFVGLLLSWPKNNVFPCNRFLVMLIIFLTVVSALLTGRRGFAFGVLVSFFVSGFYIMWLPGTERHESYRRASYSIAILSALFAFLVAYIVSNFGFEIESYVDFMATGFDFDSDRSASARKDQFYALTNEWMEYPIFGKGHGTWSNSYLRSYTQPWAYELSYVALLFHVGIFGFLCYASGILWILVRSVSLIRRGGVVASYLVASNCGLVSFLIANATNPYLEKFDYMLVIFIPVAIINMEMINYKKKLVIN